MVVFRKKMFKSFFASNQISLHVLSFFDKLIIRWTTIGFEQSVGIGDIANVTNMTSWPYSSRVFPDTPSCKLPNHRLIYNVNIVQQKNCLNKILYCCNIFHTNAKEVFRILGSVPPVFSRNGLNKLEFLSSSLSFPCNCNARSLKRHKLSLYSFRVFSSNVKHLTEWFYNSRSGNTVSSQPLGTSLSNAAKTV